jgi:hypothetical protein
LDKIASAEDRWKPRAQGKRKDAHEIGDHKLIDCNIKRVRVSPERLEGRTEIPTRRISNGTTSMPSVRCSACLRSMGYSRGGAVTRFDCEQAR